MKQTFPFPIGTIHIIGIGGIGMSGYAEVLHNLGYKVQGSDQAEGANIQRLRALGVRVTVGHAADNIYDAQKLPCAVVVRSTAVKDSNPEVIAAKAQKIPVIPRVELLAEMMRSKWCINISGTHGKTTTTSMIGHVLEKSGFDPTVMNGGIINAYGSNTRLGAGEWMVVEADESDGTFTKLPSVISVITNIDPEHLDYYGSFDKAKEAFVEYAHNLPFYGYMIACIDHPVVAELLPHFQRKTITYGFSKEADIRAVNVKPGKRGLSFDIQSSLPGHMNVENVHLSMYGPHNALNALASFACGHVLGIDAQEAAQALASFTGVKRRFTTTGVTGGITIIDDYAHHPVEIAAVLRAGRDALQGRGRGRLIAVMQPHRYTRLAALFDDFANCFQGADEIVIADVYAAGEEPIQNINRDALIAALKKRGHLKVHPLANAEELPKLICNIAQEDDLVICLGAGSITHWAQNLPEALTRLLGNASKAAHGGA